MDELDQQKNNVKGSANYKVRHVNTIQPRKQKSKIC
jgi:hypothetical protein